MSIIVNKNEPCQTVDMLKSNIPVCDLQSGNNAKPTQVHKLETTKPIYSTQIPARNLRSLNITDISWSRFQHRQTHLCGKNMWHTTNIFCRCCAVLHIGWHHPQTHAYTLISIAKYQQFQHEPTKTEASFPSTTRRPSSSDISANRSHCTHRTFVRYT